MDSTCAFCHEIKRLNVSHVLPAFVYRWLRGRSGTGYIRQTDNPNRRVQDGLKLPWLCEECEGRFSRYETAFATNVFHPWQAGNTRIVYEEWLLKFCTSVSWRVLRFARGRNGEAKYTAEQQALMDQADARWRAYVKGDVPHPGAFEQHLLIWDIIEDTNIRDLPTNINRFMTGAVTLDIVGSERSLMTWAKLGQFMIFGIVESGLNRWQGTKVHVRHGVLKPGTFAIPVGLLDLFREKAAHTAASMAAISAAQRAKIDQTVLDNPEAFSASDQFAAIEADARLFGENAVLWRNPS